MKKKILFIRVPDCHYPNPKIKKLLESNYALRGAFIYSPPLALAYISAFLKKYLTFDFELTVKDINAYALLKKRHVPEEYHGYIKKVLESEYDVLLINCQFMYNQNWVESTVNLSHQLNPHAKIVVGGGYSTIFPEKAVAHPYIDYAVIGEGEHTAVHIINKIFGVKDPEFEKLFPFDGYVEKLLDGKGRIVKKKTFIDDLSKLPSADWSWMEFDIYNQNPNDPTVASLPVMYTRGCPHDCTYCSSKLYWGRRVLHRPVEKIIEEILSSYNQYGIRKFSVVDDNPTFNKNWFLEFCQSYRKMPQDIKISFNNFSIKTLDQDVIDGLKIIGQNKITIAIETGSQRMQRYINKRLDLKDVEARVNLLKKNKIRMHVCWMIGFPNETMAQIDETINMAKKLRTDSIQVWPVFPFPGTKLYEEAKSHGILNLDENDFDTMKQHTAGKILSDEWDGELLSQIAYDTQIEANTLNNPAYDTKEDRIRMKNYLKGLLTRLPEHAIICICIGYLEDVTDNNKTEHDRYYQKALDLLENEGSFFKRYMDWDFPQIVDFRRWMRQKGLHEKHPLFPSVCR